MLCILVTNFQVFLAARGPPFLHRHARGCGLHRECQISPLTQLHKFGRSSPYQIIPTPSVEQSTRRIDAEIRTDPGRPDGNLVCRVSGLLGLEGRKHSPPPSRPPFFPDRPGPAPRTPYPRLPPASRCGPRAAGRSIAAVAVAGRLTTFLPHFSWFGPLSGTGNAS